MNGAEYVRDLLNADRQNGGGAIEAALELSRQRRDTLDRLRSALVKGDTDEALSLARQLCGLEEKKLDA